MILQLNDNWEKILTEWGWFLLRALPLMEIEF